MALPGSAKKDPHACSTAGAVNAISSPPSTMATAMARIVTTTELPSRMASSTARLNGGRLGPGWLGSRGRLGGGRAAGVMLARSFRLRSVAIGGRLVLSGQLPCGRAAVVFWAVVRDAGAQQARGHQRRLRSRRRARGRAVPTAALAAAASASLAPAISMPSSSAGTSGGRNPVIRPSYMTAIRSDSA